MTGARLVGRWRLDSWQQVFDDGRLVAPLGDNVEGFIEYSGAGHMVCMIASADRPGFSTGGQWAGSDHEMAAAYRSMLAYAGSYETSGNTVVHKVELSLYPDWTGTEQRRHFGFRDDGRLVLEARLEEGTSEARTARLVWSPSRTHPTSGE